MRVRSEASTRRRPTRGGGEDVEDDGELDNRCREEESPSGVMSAYSSALRCTNQSQP
jgi:hypothetical protein